jgi:glyoxylase-like metal-dependent hydrolase (beta-lactamase superfamily II)
MKIHLFTFNAFQENTYILYDETGACVIVDPGCNEPHERNSLANFILQEKLTPKYILNTHCHLDHVFGNKWACETYKVPLIIHPADLPTLQSMPMVCSMYGLQCETSPDPDAFYDLEAGISFGNTKLKIFFTPGHAPGHICLLHEESQSLISGDVLFYESIGRTDLPGGNHDDLIDNIREIVFPLGDEITVYPGHGPTTTIGHERLYNPFLM